MSMFSIPDELMPNGAKLDEMMKETRALMPAEFAGTVNLMAHPFAGLAAMSAIGLGFASHTAGVWLGALSGATVASQRLFSSAFDDFAASADEFRDTSRTPQSRAKAVASVLIAEVGGAPATREIELERAEPAPVAEAEKILRVVETPPSVETVPDAVPKPAKIVARRAAKPAVRSPKPIPAAEDEELAAIVDPLAGKVEVPLAEAPPAVEASPLVAEASMPVASEVAPAIAEAIPAPASAEAAPTVPRKPASIEKPEAPDDLKAISGVGPKLEQVLNGLGVWTYAQVAAWTGDEIAWVDDTLGFKGRIERDGWIGQAAKLAAAKG